MLDKIGVAFILAILFLVYALAKPTGAAEVLIALMVGAGLVYFGGRLLPMVVTPGERSVATLWSKSANHP